MKSLVNKKRVKDPDTVSISEKQGPRSPVKSRRTPKKAKKSGSFRFVPLCKRTKTPELEPVENHGEREEAESEINPTEIIEQNPLTSEGPTANHLSVNGTTVELEDSKEKPAADPLEGTPSGEENPTSEDGIAGEDGIGSEDGIALKRCASDVDEGYFDLSSTSITSTLLETEERATGGEPRVDATTTTDPLPPTTDTQVGTAASEDAATETDVVERTDAETETVNAEVVEAETETEKPQVVEAETETEKPATVTSETKTERPLSVGTETDQVATAESATETDKREAVERATETDIEEFSTIFSEKLSLADADEEESAPKRRKVLSDKSCQITDTALTSANKKLTDLRNKLNRRAVENDELKRRGEELQEKCNEVSTERLSLKVQAETLQYQCVRRMHENEQLSKKVLDKDAIICSLSETLFIRDKEIALLEGKTSSHHTSSKHLADYRELEVLRIDNIRLLHDNRQLCADVDALNDELCGLRGVQEDGSDVVLMNRRLARDNTLLSDNLASVKRELRVVQQDRQETVKEVQLLRSSLKRARTTLAGEKAEEAAAAAGPLAPGVEVHRENERLVKENTILRDTLDMLREQIATLQMSTERAASLQQQLVESEGEVRVLRGEVDQLAASSSSLTDRTRRQAADISILQGENEQLRLVNDTLAAQKSEMKERMEAEISRNAILAKEVVDLKSTIEFLQMEHSFSESELSRRDESIEELLSEVEKLRENRESVLQRAKTKLKERTKKLNSSRIRLGYALMEVRQLKGS